jgi:hypothetical protein
VSRHEPSLKLGQELSTRLSNLLSRVSRLGNGVGSDNDAGDGVGGGNDAVDWKLQGDVAEHQLCRALASMQLSRNKSVKYTQMDKIPRMKDNHGYKSVQGQGRRRL